MKLKVLALVALVMLSIVPLASAQVGTWDSSFTVVNLGTADANVDITFYDEAGTSYHPGTLNDDRSNPFVLQAGKSAVIYLPGIPSGLPDGRYSVVISADQPIVAIANLVGTSGALGFNGSYSGMEDAGQTAMSMPSVNKDFYGWNSHLSIQNLTGAAMDITVDFYAGTPVAIATVTQTVPAYSSWHLDVASVATLPSGYNGSAVVHASGPVAVVDNQTVATQVIPEIPAGSDQAYNGLAGGDTTLYCPALYDQFYGWFSSLNVQNIGSVTATVTVDYSDNHANDVVEIGPNAAHLFVYNTGAHSTTFSAKVTSSGPNIVALANAANPDGQGQTYNCFFSNQASTSYYTPLAMKWFYGWNTGIQLMNVGTADAHVSIIYEGYPATAPVTVPSNGTYIFYTPGDTRLPGVNCSIWDAGWSGSAQITSDQPIVVIVNQSKEGVRAISCPDNPPIQGDWSMSVNAFPSP